MTLNEKRILVVGASSGIGAATARAAVNAGARVAISARREAQLKALVDDMKSGTAIAADATRRDDVQRMVAAAVDALGGLDLVVYAAGVGVLQRLADCDPDTWSSLYAVNVIGANLVAGAALDHLGPSGVMAFVSSRTAGDNNAYFSAYSASKAALDHCIETWRVEHPDRRFVRVVMGNCAPTEFANHMGEDLFGPALESWVKQGIPGGIMLVDDVARAMLSSLAVSLAHPDLMLPEIQLDARLDQGIELTDHIPDDG